MATLSSLLAGADLVALKKTQYEDELCALLIDLDEAMSDVSVSDASQFAEESKSSTTGDERAEKLFHAIRIGLESASEKAALASARCLLAAAKMSFHMDEGRKMFLFKVRKMLESMDAQRLEDIIASCLEKDAFWETLTTVFLIAYGRNFTASRLAELLSAATADVVYLPFRIFSRALESSRDAGASWALHVVNHSSRILFEFTLPNTYFDESSITNSSCGRPIGDFHKKIETIAASCQENELVESIIDPCAAAIAQGRLRPVLGILAFLHRVCDLLPGTGMDFKSYLASTLLISRFVCPFFAACAGGKGSEEEKVGEQHSLWVEVTDDSDGVLKFYYWNCATSESSWTPPRDFFSSQSLATRGIEASVRLLTSLVDAPRAKALIKKINPTSKILADSRGLFVSDHRSFARLLALNVVLCELTPEENESKNQGTSSMYDCLRKFVVDSLPLEKRRCAALAFWEEASALPIIACEKALHGAIEEDGAESEWSTNMGKNFSLAYNLIVLHTSEDDNPRRYVKCFDSDSGTHYYMHAITGDTRWDCPCCMECGWVEHVDEESGSTYYIDQQSGESMWQLPENLDDPSDDAAHDEEKESSPSKLSPIKFRLLGDLPSLEVPKRRKKKPRSKRRKSSRKKAKESKTTEVKSPAPPKIQSPSNKPVPPSTPYSASKSPFRVMQSPDPRRSAPCEFLCALTGALLKEPVRVTRHSSPSTAERYEKEAMTQWVETRGTDPATGRAITLKDIKPCRETERRLLAWHISASKTANTMLSPSPGSPQKLDFDEDDDDLYDF